MNKNPAPDSVFTVVIEFILFRIRNHIKTRCREHFIVVPFVNDCSSGEPWVFSCIYVTRSLLRLNKTSPEGFMLYYYYYYCAGIYMFAYLSIYTTLQTNFCESVKGGNTARSSGDRVTGVRGECTCMYTHIPTMTTSH